VGSSSVVPTLKAWPGFTIHGRFNQTFDLNVAIAGLDAGLKMVSFQFRLLYNESLLNIISVTEGPFMQNPRWNLKEHSSSIS
jgi:hypothetical protein